MAGLFLPISLHVFDIGVSGKGRWIPLGLYPNNGLQDSTPHPKMDVRAYSSRPPVLTSPSFFFPSLVPKVFNRHLTFFKPEKILQHPTLLFPPRDLSAIPLPRTRSRCSFLACELAS